MAFLGDSLIAGKKHTYTNAKYMANSLVSLQSFSGLCKFIMLIE